MTDRPSGNGTAAGGDVHRGWFPLDAERHRRDAPRYCPGCATALSLADGGQGLTTEYWTGDDRGRHRVDYVEGQDMMAWVTQGPITDRTVEHLGRSDVGVTMLRRMFKEQMTRVSRGEDPLGVYRDYRSRIELPCEKNKFDAGVSFAIDFIDRASSRFSPQADALKKLHIKAHENQKAAAG